MLTREPPQRLPRLISAQEIIPTTKRLLANIQNVRSTIAQTVELSSACFQNAIRPLIDIENSTQCELGMIAMLRYASPEDEARNASVLACQLMRESSAELVARGDLYRIFKKVHDRQEALDHESTKYLNQLLKDYTRCGHGLLDNDQIQLYLDKRNAIDNMRSRFNKSIRDENSGLWFCFEELDGVPQHELARFAKQIEPQEARLRFVRNRKVDSQVVLEYARNPATRKKMYVSSAYKLPENVGLLEEIAKRRHENACRLGYASHAAFRLETKVAKTPEFVEELFEKLEQALFPQAYQEQQVIWERKKSYLHDNNDLTDEDEDTLNPWDTAFYNRLAKEDMRVHQEKVSEYFPLRHTVLAMLEVFSSCLQLRFEHLSQDYVHSSIWHKDVEVWGVWDEREASIGEFVGYLYTDLLSRPNKHQGNQNVNIQRVSFPRGRNPNVGYLKEDGTRVKPATVLMCSFQAQTATGCPLLKHDNLISLFHELGHGIHDLLSRTSYVRFHGWSGPADFAEAPSIMLENWCWIGDELKGMSCHYTRVDPQHAQQWKEDHQGEHLPPKEIPDELLHNLTRSRDFNRASWYMRQLAFARFDMALHNGASYQDGQAFDSTATYHDLMERYLLVKTPDPSSRGHPQADFGHLCAGYDAGYYSYLCAGVFAADMFQTNFATAPRDRLAWDRYRREILEPGSSRDELEMLESFLGHPPNPQRLLGGLRSTP
ncbi:zincin [Aureobasidium pullulans]|nr:zincin [Aureobasidium pullulans]TIA16658.1 zincin [Aureobasidium pullulans]